VIPRFLLMLPVIGLVSGPAAADQDRPPAMPTRDVDVTYRAGQGDRTVVQRSRWSATARKLRLDTPTPGVYVIGDYAEHTLMMVSEQAQGVLDMELPADGLPGQAASGSASFTRRGDGKVAGHPCTEWETLDRQGQATLACYTEDGVLLEARHGAQILVQATRVVYGALDAATFAVPRSYSHERPRSAR
jgi:hypothetical protein